MAGTQILDGSGRPVVFKGIKRDGPEKYLWNSQGSANFPSRAEIDHLTNWGATLLRLPLSEDLWNGAARAGSRCPGEIYDGSYQSKVDDVVNYAAKHGIMVLISLTFTNPDCLLNPANTPGSSGGGASFPLPGPGAVTFWSDIARLYGTNPMVSFEPYDEPHVCAKQPSLTSPGNAEGTPGGGCSNVDFANPVASDTPNTVVWATGGTVNAGNSQTYRGVGLATLTNQIRAASSNLIFVDANSYSGDAYTFASPAMFGGANLVYVSHLYPSTDACAGVKSNVDWFLHWANQSGAHPVVFDEFGWPHPTESVPNEMNSLVDYFNSVGVGWSAFAWSGADYQTWKSPWALLNTSAPGPDDATGTGQPVKDAMRNVYRRTCAAGPPASPTHVKAVRGPETATVSWTAPADAASDASVVNVTYTSSQGRSRTVSQHCAIATFDPQATPQVTCKPITLTGLTDGETYSVTLTATNGKGTSPPSESMTMTDLPPSAPGDVKGEPGDHTASPPQYRTDDPSITVLWSAPAPNGGSPVTSYTVEAQPATLGGYGAGTKFEASSTPLVVHGLDHGVRYRLAVTAVNAAGESATAYSSAVSPA
ncbi:MAG: fibronectin type III domain-containing protein [Acidimicrobiales bacterium]